MNQFDLGVNRENTYCLKWDERKAVFGRADAIPLWVADMDFAAPEPVIQALVERAQHGAFGYSGHDPRNAQAVIDWMKTRHGVDVSEEAILFSPGVVDSLGVAVAAVTQPGDAVVVQTPVYGPFYGAVEGKGRVVRRNPLLNTEEGWMMDFDDLEAALKEGAKAVLLCNPHNPVGRVWRREELEQVSALAHRYGAAVIADEIHADLELPGHKNTSIIAVDPDAMAFISATKTFNLAALRQSSALIPNPDRRKAFQNEFSSRGVNGLNLFGMVAQRAAYEQGGPWLDELLAYLDGTRAFVEAFLAQRLPMIRPSRLMGTYLMWLDMRALGMEQKALCRFLIDKAGLGLTDGTGFGPEGTGFMRMNIATPRANVERAMAQLEAAMKAEGLC
ncbi:MAG: pyridoxal phosphate-dependent aminotransferase [Clostridia bacterium]|nr:pyridoxal phosphate-dependent aminotransferase [Clostridia bacterium]